MIVEISPAVQRLSETIHLDPDVRRYLNQGIATRVYGPFLEAMIEIGVDKIKDGSFDPDSIETALCTAAGCYYWADKDYAGQGCVLTDEQLTRHQANVLNGTIELVPAEATVSDEASIRQVKTADDSLSHNRSEVQAVLAALNYGIFFRPQTMASATRTLDRRQIDDLLTSLGSTQEAMPHLTVSNWGIGQTFAGVYSYAARSNGKLRIRHFDIGSGHGATLAAIINCVSNLEDIDNRPGLAMTALEATPEFYQELVQFTNRPEGVASIGLESVSHSRQVGIQISEFGALTTVRADAVTALKNMDHSFFSREDEITIITANYSWHRLNSSQKFQILKLFYQAPNPIFIIGDLAQNTSVINKRYFNLGANGPLNCGNRNLKNMFGNWGYYYAQVDLEKEKPASLDPRIARRLLQDHRGNDGHLWVAHRGRFTADALNLVKTV